MKARLTALALWATLLVGRAEAQQLQPELRLDAAGPSPWAIQPGVGAILALGYYVRVGAAAGYALSPRAHMAADRWRGDLIARVTLDPFRERRWALSLGGGVTVRRRAYLAAVADLEGPATGAFLTAFQVGFSGGFRAGIVLRRAMAGRR